MRVYTLRQQIISNANRLLTASIMVFFTSNGIGQVIYPPGRIDATIRAGGLVVPINYESKIEKNREEYISDEWNQGTIVLLTDDSIHHYPLKYNLMTDAVEVKTEHVVKVVPLSDVRRFYWVQNGQRQDYINSSGYTMTGTPFVGYLQLLSEGAVNLFKKIYLNIQKANYRPELDVGSPEDKIVREEIYFVARGTNIIELKRRNSVYDFFKQHRAKVKKYAQQNKLQPKREEDLIDIVEYYNQIFE